MCPLDMMIGMAFHICASCPEATDRSMRTLLARGLLLTPDSDAPKLSRSSKTRKSLRSHPFPKEIGSQSRKKVH
jgi:hypothetical protein